MELSYHPIPPYQFYSITQCTCERIISRSKHSIYLYQHNLSQQRFAVKQIPYTDHTLKIYKLIKQWEHLDSLVKIRGMCLMVVSQKQSKKVRINHQSSALYQQQNTNHHLQLYHPNVHLPRSPTNKNKKRKYQKTLLVWMDYYPLNLAKMIQERRKNYQYFNNQQAKQFLLQLLTVLQILQQNNFSHRDIKPENILYQGNKYRLCDFDESIIDDIDEKSIQPTTISYTSPMFLKNLMNKPFQQNNIFCPFKMDLYALGLTFLTFCSMGKFKSEQRLQYMHDPSIHEEFMRQQRRKYIKDTTQFHEFNVIVKIMLEKDELKRDDFKIIMMRIKQGISGLYISNYKFKEIKGQNQKSFLKSIQPASQQNHRQLQEDSSQMGSKAHKLNDFKKSARIKRGKLGGTTKQGNFLIALILITFTCYFILFLTHSS